MDCRLGSWLAGVAIALGMQGAAAQQPQLVVDLHTGAGPVLDGMNDTSGRVVGGVRYFGASDGIHGQELWRSDGTEAGTFLLRDIHPGAGGSRPLGLVAFGPGFCFTADDGASGRELWCSDGSREGTQRVADIRPGPENGSPSGLTVHADRLWFSADDGVHGDELWSSDGTEAGTRLLQDLAPGTLGSSPAPLASLARGLLFSARADSLDTLMLTDGTASGTAQVDPYVEPSGSSAVTYGGRAYFHGSFGELWGSDGTDAGTEEIFLDAQDPAPGDLLATPAGVLFADWNADNSQRVLWCLDNPFSPEQLSVPAAGGGLEMGVVSGRVFVTGGSARTLWFTGCGASAIEIGGAGITYDDVNDITEFDGDLYFRASSDGVGSELHRYQGGGAVELMDDIRVGALGSAPSALAAVGQQLLMSADDGSHGRELWARSPGNRAALVRNLALDGGSSRPRLLGTVNGRVVFIAFRADVGRELFASDGSAAGTVLLADAEPGAADGITSMDLRHHAAVPYAGHLYYVANSPAAGEELWRTDGTPAGTALVADLCPGTCDGMDHHFVPGSMVATEQLLFFATAPGTGFVRLLWRSDGTAGGTFALAAGAEIPNDLNRPIATLGDLVLFAGEDDDSGRELWASDGTPEGTVLLRDINPGAGHSDPDWFTRVGDWIYFVADDSFGNRELWRSDGTPVRTRRVADIRPGEFDGSKPHHLTAHQGILYFSADDGSSGYELWRSDGTTEGTWRVRDIAAGIASAWPRALVSSATGLFFAADDGSSGPEPWFTDGTPEGTRRPVSVTPLPRDRLPGRFVREGDGLQLPGSLVPRQGGVADYAAPIEILDTGDGRVVFRGCDEAFGCQVWITFADPSIGTQRLTAFGLDGGAAPGHLTLLDGTLYFAANAEGSGRELWKLALPPRPAPIFADSFELRN